MYDFGGLQDRYAIAEIIQQVAQAFDQKLHDSLLKESFTPDAVIHYWLDGKLIDFSMPQGTELFKYYHDRCYWTQHLVSPQIVEVEACRARAVTPVHAVHVQILDDGSRNNWLIGATYHDELERRQEGWRIRHRTVSCPYVDGNFLEDGIQLFPSLPSYR